MVWDCLVAAAHLCLSCHTPSIKERCYRRSCFDLSSLLHWVLSCLGHSLMCTPRFVFAIFHRWFDWLHWRWLLKLEEETPIVSARLSISHESWCSLASCYWLCGPCCQTTTCRGISFAAAAVSDTAWRRFEQFDTSPATTLSAPWTRHWGIVLLGDCSVCLYLLGWLFFPRRTPQESANRGIYHGTTANFSREKLVIFVDILNLDTSPINGSLNISYFKTRSSNGLKAGGHDWIVAMIQY